MAGTVTAQSVEQVAAQAKNGYVTDLAGVLSQSARDQLTALCTEVQQKTQAQIAVVTIRSLEDRPIEDYSIDLATRLGIGPKSTNRGVLILLAVADHRYRIEVGYGLESILPDGKVGGFGREAVPYFRANDYDGAILLMTRRVADVIAADNGVSLSGSSPPPPRGEPSGVSPGLWGLLPFLFFLFVVFALARILNSASGSRGRHPGSGSWIVPMMMMGGPRGRGWRGGGWGGGFGGGGFGGGGSFGGGGGFGGFGGGGFGGGGASGGW